MVWNRLILDQMYVVFRKMDFPVPFMILFLKLSLLPHFEIRSVFKFKFELLKL